MMAQHFGAKDYRELSRAVSGSITLCVVFGVLLAVGGQLLGAAHSAAFEHPL